MGLVGKEGIQDPNSRLVPKDPMKFRGLQKQSDFFPPPNNQIFKVDLKGCLTDDMKINGALTFEPGRTVHVKTKHIKATLPEPGGCLICLKCLKCM